MTPPAPPPPPPPGREAGAGQLRDTKNERVLCRRAASLPHRRRRHRHRHCPPPPPPLATPPLPPPRALLTSAAAVGHHWTLCIRSQLMNWDFMNFDMKLKTTTHLFTIKEELTRRHGLIKNLVICKVRRRHYHTSHEARHSTRHRQHQPQHRPSPTPAETSASPHPFLSPAAGLVRGAKRAEG